MLASKVYESIANFAMTFASRFFTTAHRITDNVATIGSGPTLEDFECEEVDYTIYCSNAHRSANMGSREANPRRSAV